MSERWPGITQACLWVAIENGGLNRFRSEKMIRREIARWLERQPEDMLAEIEPWLLGLTKEEFFDKCMGDAEEASTYLAEHAPPFTDDLLNRYFDEVC